MAEAEPLFACTKCNSRHPFNKLSRDSQLCKVCRGSCQTVTCTYCRSGFQRESKSHASTACKKCDQNVKTFGKPTACSYCNIIAAFVDKKCQRCAYFEAKYGLPKICEQCRQKCAFDKRQHKVLGKVLCWLCEASYKRVLAKVKQTGGENILEKNSKHRSKHGAAASAHATNKSRHGHSSRHNSNISKDQKERHHASATLKRNSFAASISSSIDSKKIKFDDKPSGKSPLLQSLVDPASSDHVIALTNLKDEIAALKKQLAQKDATIIEKEKKSAELNSHNMDLESRQREKIQNVTKNFQSQIDELVKKNRELQAKNQELQKQMGLMREKKRRNINLLAVSSSSTTGRNTPTLSTAAIVSTGGAANTPTSISSQDD